MDNIITLKKRHGFQHMTKHAGNFIKRGFIIQYLLQQPTEPADQPPMMRIGLTASRRIGNAVIRNRAKRRLRALIRLCLPHYGVAGMDYVLIARHNTATLNFALLEQELTTTLKTIAANPTCRDKKELQRFSKKKQRQMKKAAQRQCFG